MLTLTTNRKMASLVLPVAMILMAASCAPAAAPAPPSGSGQPGKQATDQSPPPVTRADFKRPELLVETDRLAALLSEKNLRIVDLRAPDKYAQSHLPGAVNLNSNALDEKVNDQVQDLAAPAKVAEVLGNLGIGDDVKVVLYDDQRTLNAGRVFWALDYLGQKDVSVLNGGFPKWEAEKRETTRVVPKVDKVVFTPRPDPTKIADTAYVKSHAGDQAVTICDARTAAEYEGTDVRAARGGRIPGAKNVNWEDNLTAGNTPVMQEAARLKQLYEQAGVTPDKEIITYCQSGVRAAQAYFTLRLLGYPKVRNYDGSWQAWGNDSTLPLETGKKG